MNVGIAHQTTKTTWTASGEEVKFSVELPAAIREAFEYRAEFFSVNTYVAIGAAIEWFVDREANDLLPPPLIDIRNVPEIETTFPRSLSLKIDSGLRDALDAIAAKGTHGTKASAVVRSALCLYITAAGMKYDSRYTTNDSGIPVDVSHLS